MKSEKEIQKSIIKWLKDNEIYHFKTIVSNRNGIPDIIVCYNGLFIGIEVKSPKGKATTLQNMEIKKIKENGGVAFIARSLEDVVTHSAFKHI